MTLFLAYILKTGICLIVFYLFYRILLSKETYHRFNRIMLIGVGVLSAVLPFAKISFARPETKVQEVPFSVQEMDFIVQQEAAPNVSPFSVIICVISILYCIGCLFFFFRTVVSFVRLAGLFGKEKTVLVKDRIRIFITDHTISPFSWMNRIVVARKDWEENGDIIFSHESGHICCKHSWDLLFIQIGVIFQWFNPAVWLLKQELQNIHEYEADEYVLNKGIDAKHYQLLLIKKAVGSQRFTSMANSFNHSKLKKRMTMMLKRKSNPWARVKYLYVLPVAMLVTTVFAHPEVSGKLSKISEVKISEILNEKKDSGEKKKLLDIPALSESSFLIVIDGEEATLDKLYSLDTEMIQGVEVEAIDQYSEKDKKGVIRITTGEKNPSASSSTVKIERKFEINGEAVSEEEYLQRKEAGEDIALSSVSSFNLEYGDGKEIKIETKVDTSKNVLEGDEAVEIADIQYVDNLPEIRKDFSGMHVSYKTSRTTEDGTSEQSYSWQGANTEVVIDGKKATLEDFIKLQEDKIESITVREDTHPVLHIKTKK